MDNDNPLVSICIPVFNHGAYIRRALESSIHQTYKNIEIVVVDNASTDNTREVVSEYVRRDNRVKYFRNETNIGGGRNFLKCAELASGYFMEALGSDDWLSKNYIEEGVKNFLANLNIASVFAGDLTFSFLGVGAMDFVGEAEVEPGEYPADWFFSHFYRHPSIAGRGFHSFMRRNDFIGALKKTLNNPINLFQRGEIKEPFDTPVFLNVLAGYDSFLVIKTSAYIKTVHGKDHVGLQGKSFGSPVGQVRYATALRLAYESFFDDHRFKKYFRQLRFFGGLSMESNAILFFLSGRFKKAIIRNILKPEELFQRLFKE